MNSQDLTEAQNQLERLEIHVKKLKQNQILEKLQTKKTELENQINYKETILKSLQKKTDDLKLKFETETERLTELAHNQAKEVSDSYKQEHEELSSDLKELKKSHLLLIDENSQEIAQLEKKLKKLKKEVADEETRLQDLSKDCEVLESKGETLAKQIDKQTDTNNTLTGKEVELRATLTQLNDDIKDTELKAKEVTESLKDLTSDYEQKKSDFESQINILQAESNQLAQSIIDQQKEQESTRANLAEWAKKLEQQDQNLRVWAEKLSQRDKILLRNSNLLKM